jgi:hypothetical protein
MNSRRAMWIAMRPSRGALAKERAMLLRCESLEPTMSQLGQKRKGSK